MRSSAAGGAHERGSGGNQFKHQPLIHPERPQPVSLAMAGAAWAEILLWLGLLLLVVGVARGLK